MGFGDVLNFVVEIELGRLRSAKTDLGRLMLILVPGCHRRLS